MSTLRFASSAWLLLLLVLPVLVLRYVQACRRHGSRLRYSDLSGLRHLAPTLTARLRHAVFGLKMLGLCCLVLGMARPQAGRQVREVSAQGIDIMLALDVSSSMELNDLDEGQKTRLQVAKEVVAQFIRGRVSDRIGMVVFAAQSFTQCPLTLDYGVLLQFLQGVDIAAQEWDGTAIGMGLINACNRLRESKAKSQVIILLTDGVNNAGEIEPVTAAEVAAAVGIRIYAIGVGSEGAIRRPVRGFFGTRYQTIQVEMDEETLRQVAARTGGRYYRATSEQKLQEIYEEIGRLETTPVQAKIHVDYAERYAYFLWPGLLLLLAEAALANTRFRQVP